MEKLTFILIVVISMMVGVLLYKMYGKKSTPLLSESCPPCECPDQPNFTATILSNIGVFLGKNIEQINNDQVKDLAKALSSDLMSMAQRVSLCLDQNLDNPRKLMVLDFWRKMKIETIPVDNEDNIVKLVINNIQNPPLDPETKKILEHCEFNRMLYILGFLAWMRKITVIQVDSPSGFWKCISGINPVGMYEIILTERTNVKAAADAVLTCMNVYME